MEERIGIDVIKSTHTKFETILSKVQAYLKDNYKVRDMYLKELDHQFIVGFEHLRVNEKIDYNPHFVCFNCLLSAIVFILSKFVQ